MRLCNDFKPVEELAMLLVRYLLQPVLTKHPNPVSQPLFAVQVSGAINQSRPSDLKAVVLKKPFRLAELRECLANGQPT